MAVATQRSDSDSAQLQEVPAASGTSAQSQHIPAELRTMLGRQILQDPNVYGQLVARPFRILIVATEAPPVRSGIAREIGYLRDGLRKRGHHVDVLAYPEIGRLAVGELRLSGLVVRLPRLLYRIKEYDVIHIHGATPTLSDVALLLARLETHLWAIHPAVIYTHQMDVDFGPGGFLNRIYNSLHHRLSAGADIVVASTRDKLAEFGDERRGLVIPNAVDLEQFNTNGQKDSQFTVLFVGQFRPYKGVHVLLQAMSQVRGGRLLLAGHGPGEQAYRAHAATLGLDVEFHVGASDEQLRRLYQRAHVVVLPSVSRAEAFGIVLVEGMAAGCIPVASDLPGVREVVGSTGFLFPVGSVNKLATILCSLRDDPAVVRWMGGRAHLRAVSFGREHMVSEYEHIIESLVEVRELRMRLVNLAAHMDVPGLIASRDVRDHLVHDAESCALALHAFANNAWDLTWDNRNVVVGLDPPQDALCSALPADSAVKDALTSVQAPE